MKKALLLLSAAAFILQSCGGNSSDETTTTSTTPINESKPSEIIETKSESTSLFEDAAALQKAEDDLKALPQYAGKDLNVFQNVSFYNDGRISIEIQDPNKPANIDHYDYKNGKWSDPQPVQISGDGDMSANTTPLSKIKFATVATIYKNWMDKSKEVEGADKKPLSHVYFSLFVPNQSREWRTSGLDGTREKYDIKYNDDGSVKEFKKS